MNEARLRLDREYVKEKLRKDISKEIDYVFDNLEKVNKARVEHNKSLIQTEIKLKILARGFVIRIGVLLTKKQYEKRYLQKTNANTKSEDGDKQMKKHKEISNIATELYLWNNQRRELNPIQANREINTLIERLKIIIKTEDDE